VSNCGVAFNAHPAGLFYNWPFFGSLYQDFPYLKAGQLFNDVGGKGWDDPQLDALFTQAITAVNPNKVLQEMTARMTTEADFLPLISTSAYTYFNPKVVSGVTQGLVTGWPITWSPTK
jgi:hypothetical protein